MIHRDFTTDIEITPRELANELWEQKYKNYSDGVIARYDFLKKEINSCLTKEERDDIMNMLKMLIAHLESEDNNG